MTPPRHARNTDEFITWFHEFFDTESIGKIKQFYKTIFKAILYRDTLQIATPKNATIRFGPYLLNKKSCCVFAGGTVNVYKLSYLNRHLNTLA